MTERPLLLQMEGITKQFLGVPALIDASFAVGHAEVHALIGQNGAGKSTLIKVLTGVHPRDSGRIRFDGRDVDFSSPHAAQLGGVSTIYQEVNLVPYRSVAENIFLGREPRRRGLLDWRRMNAEAADLLGRLDVSVDVTRPLNEYAIATQQMTALARALSTKARLVVMDEPTSALADQEVQTLFRVIRQLKADGISVVFVSHRLDELYAVCDRVTIMRDGRVLEDSPMSEVSRYDLVSKMLGRELAATLSQRRSADHADGEHPDPVAQLDDVRRGAVLDGVDLALRPGEIVGLAGLLGSGRTETARALFGADRIDGGRILIRGRPVELRSPRDAIDQKMGFAPEDRKVEGIVPQLSVKENLTLALLPHLRRHGVIDRHRQNEVVLRFIQALGIKCSGPEQPVRELSGGNQQKVLVARWLCTDPTILILDEPTRGIDVGAKQDIQVLIRGLADEGLAVLLISSELEEVVANADRVVTMRDGATVAEFTGDDITETTLMAAMATGTAATETGPGPGREGAR